MNYLRTLMISLCTLVSLTAISQTLGVEPPSDFIGTVIEYQAIATTAKFLELVYNVPEKSIVVNILGADGDWMNMQAVIPGHVCTVMLFKNIAANKFGWVVKTHTCSDPRS